MPNQLGKNRYNRFSAAVYNLLYIYRQQSANGKSLPIGLYALEIRSVVRI